MSWLTGLNNRRFFIDKLNEYLEQYGQASNPFSLLILDVDHFKLINDTYGHPFGDKVLVRLAELLMEFFSEDHTIARYGGEEFVVIMPSTNAKKSLDYAEQLRSRIEAAECESIKVTASIGVATSSHSETTTTILAKADKALYNSKEKGRNRVTHASLSSPFLK